MKLYTIRLYITSRLSTSTGVGRSPDCGRVVAPGRLRSGLRPCKRRRLEKHYGPGVTVGRDAWLGVGVGVGRGVRVDVGVLVSLGVAVGVAVGVCVAVRVAVGVRVKVAVRVAVGV